ncbi:MAG: hypothetical protein AB9900_10965 [Humidesulfovibrio sp.]
MQPKIVGFIWYREEQYAEVLRICTDRHKLPHTYARFVQLAQAGIDHLRAQGITAVKVEADVDELAAWCAANAQNVDSNGRVAFVNAKLARMILPKG